MTKVADAAAKRAEQIVDIHGLADWLAAHPDIPMPTLGLHRHLHNVDGTDVENLATVRRLAASIGVDADENLDDRTVLRYRVNEHVWYELYAWHKDGRDAQEELERLRARVAELEARDARPAEPKPEVVDADVQAFAADLTGLAYTRADDDTADPTPPGPREPLHTGAMTEHGLVDETPAEHCLVGGSVGGFGENSAECACGTVFDGFDSSTEANRQLGFHIEAATSPPGLIVGDTADEQRDNAYAAYGRDEAECPSAWHANQGDERSRCPICNQAD